MTQNEFLDAVGRNADRIYKYEYGHDGSDGKCDCIGQIVGAVRLAGLKWPWTHGSNYAARYRTNDQHYVGKASEQELGNLVYKARSPGEEKYDLPSTYNKHPDQKDYYHVGVVTNINPLIITHCTSVEGGIKRDNNLGAWHYAGSLNQIDGKGGSVMPVDYLAVVKAESGTTVNLRQNPSTKASVQKTVRVGTTVEVVEEYNDDWAKIKTDDVAGYMMRKFLKIKNDTITVSRDELLSIYEAIGKLLGEE